jgi:hypothetical protein
MKMDSTLKGFLEKLGNWQPRKTQRDTANSYLDVLKMYISDGQEELMR